MKSLREKAYGYIVETVAISAETTPFYAAYETFVVNMSNDVSQDARKYGVGILLLGLGTLFQKGRESSENFFRVAQYSSWARPVHDIAYNAVFSAAVGPALYLISGEKELEKIFLGTVGAAFIGVINGMPIGYTIDVFRDLGGIKTCERPSYPAFLKNASASQKAVCALGLLLASGAFTRGIYAVHEQGFSLEQIMESQSYDEIMEE